jgi:hypothetical protein
MRTGRPIARVGIGVDSVADVGHAWIRHCPVAQRDARFADVAQALLRIALEAARQQLAHARRRGGRQRREIDRLGEDGRDDVADGFAVEEPAAREHFVEDNAERPDVRAPVDGLAARLLGRHVGGGAENHAGLRHGGRRERE